MKIVKMSCPNCGASLKQNSNKREAVCEYCGYHYHLEKEDKAYERAYEYHKGRLAAESEAAQKKKQRRVKKGPLIIGIILLLAIAVNLAPELSKPRINPFDYIEVSFQGKDGEGKVTLDTADAATVVDSSLIEYDISKERYLFEGDTISISAQSDYYRLSESSKIYTVDGLDEYLKDLENIPEEALKIIHVKAESRLELNLDRCKNAGVFIDMTPVKLFLTTDGKQTNELYDVFEAHFMTRSGEKTCYVLTCFDDVVIRNSEQVSIDMSTGMYFGHLTQIEGSLWIMAYESLDEIRADILTSQDSYMELKELDL